MGFHQETSRGPAMWRDLPHNGHQTPWAPGDDDNRLVSILDAINSMRPAWMKDAACRGMAPKDGQTEDHIFFPERGEEVDAAKAICHSCPVQTECFEYGLEEKAGVWGNATGRQRRAVVQDRKGKRPSVVNPMVIECVICGDEFTARNPGAKYCDIACAQVAERNRQKRRSA